MSAKNMNQSAAMLSKVQEAKCPNCGGPLVYDVEKGTLICSHCKSQIDTGLWQDHKISGFDFRDMESHVIQEQADDIPIYNCVSCGAEVLAADTEVSLTCPYCRNNIILTDKVSGKLRPHAIIPFKITPDRLPAALQRFYKDKVLLPKNFFSESTLSKVTGIYVPFWSFTGELSGDISYRGEKRSLYSTSDEDVTVVQEYKLLREAHVSFRDLILDASERLRDDLMDSIAPFDLSGAVDFNVSYLAGFAADRFDTLSTDLFNRAEERMRQTAYRVVKSQADAGYSNVKLAGGALQADMQEVKYILLPVYIFHISYEGIPYTFAMNGQTGKVVGEVPISKAVSFRYRWLRNALVFAAVMLISIYLYFAGV